MNNPVIAMRVQPVQTASCGRNTDLAGNGYPRSTVVHE